MKHLGWVLFGLLLFLAGFGFLLKTLSGKVSVKTGAIITCPLCNRTILNNVKTLKVPKEEASNYRVFEKSEFCEECKTEVISTVRNYMEAFNNQDVATIFSIFSEKSQRVANEMAEKSTGEYYRKILSGPNVSESGKENVRRALENPFKYPISDAQFEVLSIEDVRFTSPEREDRAKSPVWVRVDSPSFPYSLHLNSIHFLLIKENGQWRIREIT
jgi:hypothetical protein